MILLAVFDLSSPTTMSVACEPIDNGSYQVYYGSIKLALYDTMKRKLIELPVTRRKRR